jgi:hypothetical protein
LKVFFYFLGNVRLKNRRWEDSVNANLRKMAAGLAGGRDWLCNTSTGGDENSGSTISVSQLIGKSDCLDKS